MKSMLKEGITHFLALIVLLFATLIVDLVQVAAQNEEENNSGGINITYTPAPTLKRKEEEQAGGLATNTTVVLIVLPCCLVVLVSIFIVRFCSRSDVKPIDGTNHRQRNAQARQELQRERWDPADAIEGNATTEADTLNANQKWSLAKLTYLTKARAFRFVSFLGLSGRETTTTDDDHGDELEQQQQIPEPPRMSNNFVETAENPTISISIAFEDEDTSASTHEDERTPLFVTSDSGGLFRNATEVTTVRAFSPASSLNSMSNSLRNRHQQQQLKITSPTTVVEQPSPLAPHPLEHPDSKIGDRSSSSTFLRPSF